MNLREAVISLGGKRLLTNRELKPAMVGRPCFEVTSVI